MEELRKNVRILKSSLSRSMRSKADRYQRFSDLRSQAWRIERELAKSTRRFRFRTVVRDQHLQPVIVSVIPLVLAALSFVVGFVLTESWLISILCGIVSAIYIAMKIRSYLYSPEDAELQEAIRVATVQLPELTESLVKAESEYRMANSTTDRIRRELDSARQQLERELDVRENLRKLRADDLLDEHWRQMRGIEFEQFLKRVFEHLGYAVEDTRVSGDQGVDLIARCDTRNLAIQAKGYSGSVGNASVQQAYAGMAFYSCDRCAVVTNSTFTSSAQQLAEKVNCVLIDSESMSEFIHGESKYIPRV